MFIASPMTGMSSPGTNTSPVVIPIRAASRIGKASFSVSSRCVHLDRCTHRAQPVVLVGQRHAEDGDHRVADELLHPTAVALDG